MMHDMRNIYILYMYSMMLGNLSCYAPYITIHYSDAHYSLYTIFITYYTLPIYLIYLLYTPHPYTIDVSLGRLSSSDDCAIFIATKNNVGDPVIRTVQAICEMYTNLTAIFLNCDLSDRVTSGKDKSQNYEGCIYICILFFV